MKGAALFAAAYGFLPPGAEKIQGAALGLLANARMVRAIKTQDLVRAIQVAFGDTAAMLDLAKDAGASPKQLNRMQAQSMVEKMRSS